MVSNVTSGVTPAGSGIEDELCRFVGVTPAGNVVCAFAGTVISTIEAIDKIAKTVAVVFAVFLDKYIFFSPFSLWDKKHPLSGAYKLNSPIVSATVLRRKKSKPQSSTTETEEIKNSLQRLL